VDVYYSPLDETYAVNVDGQTGVHDISIDEKYPFVLASTVNSNSRRRSKRQNNATSNSTFSEKVYTMQERYAEGYHSFITVAQHDMFLIVKDVHDRLVITLPNSIHNLKIARFYLIIRGRSGDSFGAVLFRQDQPHIDLFVFFSVFFSCFFLFLAVCVLLWKAKQVLDSQRSRHQRRLEMKHMASRPFAKVLVVIDSPFAPDSPRLYTHSMDRLRPRLSKHTSKYSLSAPPPESVVPLASEPTDDGIAAVSTFFFQLPGGSSAPTKACLGSALVTNRVLYPNHPHLMSKTRRRASHGSVTA
jgi:hypothetical protein